MPLPIIADTYRLALNWTGPSGSHAVNVMHLRKAATTAAAIAATMDANVTTNMWSNVTASALVTSLQVTPLDGTSATYILATSGAKWTGPAGAGDFVPAAAAIVSLRSVLRGRSNRGRLYLPFQAELNMSNGVLSSVALAQTAWNNWLTAMVAAGAQPVIASYLHGTQHDIASINLELILGTQRRRQSRLR